MQTRQVILALIGIIALTLTLSGCNVNLPEQPGQAYTQLAQQVMQQVAQGQTQIKAPMHECTDSDNGKNLHDYGYTIESVAEQKIKNTDTCSGNVLKEAVCKEGFVKAIEAVQCADYNMVCANGACTVSAEAIEEQQCIDSDDGLNMMDFGFTTEFRNNRQITNDDKCTGNVLRETVCKRGITKATERVNCEDYGMVCSEGVCVQEEDAGAAGGDEDEEEAGGQRGPGGPTCVDPDGENPHVLGTLVFTYANGRQTTYRDECDPAGRYVWEQMCTVDPNTNNPTFGTRSIDCQAIGEVCSNGVCAAAGAGARRAGAGQATCTDSDNGVNSAIRGTVTITNPDGRVVTKTDTCYDEGEAAMANQGQYVADYICNAQDPGISMLQPIDCVAQHKTCRNGVCVALVGGGLGGINPDDLARLGTDRLGNLDLISDALSGAGQAEARDGAAGIEQYSCTDSDNGKNSAVFGSVRQTGPDGRATSFSDNCMDGNKLSEQYCTDTHRRGSATIDCAAQDKICRNGICAAISTGTSNIRLCLDYDGDNMYTASQVDITSEGQTRVEKDVCLNNDALREHICGPNNVHGAKTYYCSNEGYSCKDGKCVDLRVSRIQQPLSSAGQATQTPIAPSTTIIKQYPVLQNTLIRNII